MYWGNRNWEPYLADTVAHMAAGGVRRALAFVTSAYSSFSSCRQYLNEIGAARAKVGASAPAIDKIRQYFNHPGFIGTFAAAAADAVRSLPADASEGYELIFTAHSIPEAMAAASGPRGGAYLGSANRSRGPCRGRAWLPAALAPRLLEPQRTAVPTVARAGHQ